MLRQENFACGCHDILTAPSGDLRKHSIPLLSYDCVAAAELSVYHCDYTRYSCWRLVLGADIYQYIDWNCNPKRGRSLTRRDCSPGTESTILDGQKRSTYYHIWRARQGTLGSDFSSVRQCLGRCVYQLYYVLLHLN